ncbi:MAG: hypothetical protein QXU32_02265 [Nitrososphaerales archaeon]
MKAILDKHSADHWWEPDYTHVDRVDVPGLAPGMSKDDGHILWPGMMRCPHCGRPTGEYREVCPECGMRIHKMSTSVPNWVFLDGHVEIANEPYWSLAERVALDADYERMRANRISNLLARGLLPYDEQIAVGQISIIDGEYYPQVWLSTIDRNVVYDAVIDAMENYIIETNRVSMTKFAYWTLWRDNTVTIGNSVSTDIMVKAGGIIKDDKLLGNLDEDDALYVRPFVRRNASIAWIYDQSSGDIRTGPTHYAILQDMGLSIDYLRADVKNMVLGYVDNKEVKFANTVEISTAKRILDALRTWYNNQGIEAEFNYDYYWANYQATT